MYPTRQPLGTCMANCLYSLSTNRLSTAPRQLFSLEARRESSLSPSPLSSLGRLPAKLSLELSGAYTVIVAPCSPGRTSVLFRFELFTYIAERGETNTLCRVGNDIATAFGAKARLLSQLDAATIHPSCLLQPFQRPCANTLRPLH